MILQKWCAVVITQHTHVQVYLTTEAAWYTVTSLKCEHDLP